MKKLTDLALAKLCRTYSLEKKAVDPKILDLRKLPGPADFFVICSGESDPQLKAIANSIQTTLKKEHEVRPVSINGTPQTGWIVIDYGTVFVHIMHPLKRAYYRLEELWGDCRFIP